LGKKILKTGLVGARTFRRGAWFLTPKRYIQVILEKLAKIGGVRIYMTHDAHMPISQVIEEMAFWCFRKTHFSREMTTCDDVCETGIVDNMKKNPRHFTE